MKSLDESSDVQFITTHSPQSVKKLLEKIISLFLVTQAILDLSNIFIACARTKPQGSETAVLVLGTPNTGKSFTRMIQRPWITKGCTR